MNWDISITKNRYQDFLILLFFTILLLLLSSNEGWLRIEYPHIDSTWFYMAGKSWMNGLTPYVDFTDSKGPLLWLVYGLGYLISPRSMHGLFFIQVLFYWATFIFLFRASLIILSDRFKSLLASMLMALFFFQPWIHYEIRAEDYCQLFNAITFYSLIYIFKVDASRRLPYLFLGLSVAASMLIKYNIALMLLAPSGGVALYLLVKTPRKFPTLLLWWFTGFAIVAAPFFFYFIFFADFQAFINEYFLYTFQTIEVQHPYSSIGESFWQRWPVVIVRYFFKPTPGWTLAIKLACISILFLFSRIYRPLWLRISILLWFVAALLLTTYMHSPFYLNSTCIFLILPILFLVHYFPKMSMPALLFASGLIIFIVGYSLTFISKGEFRNPQYAIEVFNDKKNISKLIDAYSANHNNRLPSIMFVRTSDTGVGLLSETLPASKYWAQQAGATFDMYKRHTDDIFQEKPDFIAIPHEETGLIDSIENIGYRKIYSYYPTGSNRDFDFDLHYLYVKGN